MISALVSTAALLLLQFRGAPDLVELARSHGGTLVVNETFCRIATNLAFMTRLAPVVFEGTVLSAESRLSHDRADVYSEYLFEVIRVLHATDADVREAGDPVMGPLPFEASAVARPSAHSPVHARLVAPGGQLHLDGLEIRHTVGDARMLAVGEHVVVFATYAPWLGRWEVSPIGVLDVRSERLAPLSRQWQAGDFSTVQDIAAALEKLAARRR